MTTLHLSLSEAAQGNFVSFSYEYEFSNELHGIWSSLEIRSNWSSLEVPPPSQHGEIEGDAFCYSRVPFSRAEPEPTSWSIAFTPSFRKSVATFDKKLQGRVLSAISELSETPITIHGDTVKPLVGELKGLWRYRVGDYRLVYEPRQESRLVVLLEFAPRGGAYEP
ncbi:MAG: type II toxin-antitoxin system RelE/ParE family toxin [Acidobacteria bacterium]|nr:type II toxin-antitoxin system RelE/ParE family toxin [Acidobacteriota bacterium]